MSQGAPESTSRRSARRQGRRFDLMTVLAVCLPVVCALALVAVRPGDLGRPAQEPTLTALTRAAVVCPSAMSGSPSSP